jgi:hypothetical protein
MGRFATPGGKQLLLLGARSLPVSPKTVPFGVPEKRDRLAVKAHGASIPGGKAEPCSFITTN